jgi:hypothetical protein
LHGAGQFILELEGLQFDTIKTLGAIYGFDGDMNMSEVNAFQMQWYAEAEGLARAIGERCH